MFTLLAEQELIQCRTFQLLLGAATAIMIFSPTTYRVRLRFYNDFNVIALFCFVQIHFRHNT